MLLSFPRLSPKFRIQTTDPGRRRKDGVAEAKQIVQNNKKSKERKARFRTCDGLVAWATEIQEKKIDMKEGYRPAAAKKETRGREAEGRSETATASGAVSG